MTEEHWGIVGGGMLGLTMALLLVEEGKQVTVLEQAPQLGGLASAWQLGDIVWDRHYHVTLLSDVALLAVLGKIGLEQEIEWVETRTGSYTDGVLYSVSNTIEFLRFPPLRLTDKLRLGATIWFGSRIRDWHRLETVLLAEWLTRWSGRNTFLRFWLPLLRAKLGDNYQQASAAFIWATIQRLYAARRTGLKKEMFGYVPGGYARILERLAAVLKQQGVTIETGTSVIRIEASSTGPMVTTGSFECTTFDRVVVTSNAPVAARVIEGLDPSERALLDGISYQGIVCASLLLKHPLAGYYLTYITDPSPFTGVIEMSALVDRKHFAGHTLVYLPAYVSPDDPLFEASDDQVRKDFVEGLARMYPHFDEDEVLAFRVSRVRHVLPIPTLRYSESLPPMTTSVSGVHLVNSAHIVNGTLNVNETVELANRAVASLAGSRSGMSEEG